MASPSSTNTPVDHHSAKTTDVEPLWMPGARRWPAWRLLAIGLAGAWALVVVAYLTHTAAILPVLILVATASLLRGGRTLLDRLILAFALLVGAVGAAGLLFSLWPWGLHPVPVAGAAFTTLVLVAAALGRRPALPRPRWTDALSVGAAALIGAIVAWPLLGQGQFNGIAQAMSGEDGARHFAVFDAIRHVGGFLFLHWDAAEALVYRGMITYPQGSHLLFALLDNFLRSSASDFGTGPDAFSHYLFFFVCAYATFALVLIWAVQWLAGPLLTTGRRIVLVAAAVAFCLSNRAFYMVMSQWLGEVAGLTLVVLLIAILARPTARTRQTMVIAAGLVLAVGLTYYLYLPAAGLAVVIWLLRRRLVRRHTYLVALIVVSGLAATIPAIIGILVADQDRALLMASEQSSRDGTLVYVLLAVTALIGGRSLVSPIWRSFRWVALAPVVAWVCLVAVQVWLGGSVISSSYYADKMLDLVATVALLAVGAFLGYLPQPQPEREPRGEARARGGTTMRLIPVGLVALALAAGSGLIFGDSPYQPNGSALPRAWVRGALNFHPDIARVVLDEVARRDTKPGTVTVVMAENPDRAYTMQLLLAALQRTSGAIGDGMYTGRPLDAPERMEDMVVGIDGPVLIIADTAGTQARAEAIKDRHPDLDITVARAYG